MNGGQFTRSIRKIEYAPRFLKHLRKLPKQIIAEAERKEAIFKSNSFHPLLHTHKLSGKEKEHWAFWIARDYRIKFIFLTDEEVLFLDVGTHDEVYR